MDRPERAALDLLDERIELAQRPLEARHTRAGTTGDGVADLRPVALVAVVADERGCGRAGTGSRIAGLDAVADVAVAALDRLLGRGTQTRAVDAGVADRAGIAV